ncbi:hypothetical protein [Porphyromonas pogonae]|uniref:type IX secretion system periplasmic lipoprotein PorW/SprE n=1 Tax=Porphyromonas pogonae TaxID=867595 RepID=UPI002E7A1A55|nr:hypothetical protein [Porphyromonas pogonae]
MTKRSLIYVLSCVISVALLASCGVRRNTPVSRWYQGFTTRYNVLYNGEKAFDQAYKSRLVQDDVHFFALQEPDVAPLHSSGDFDIALQKADKAIAAHSIITYEPGGNTREHNPVLYKVWLLKGKSMFFNGDYTGASAVFGSIYKEDTYTGEVRQEALLWKTRCDLRIDTTSLQIQHIIEVTTNHPTTVRLRELAVTEYYLRTPHPAQALPYLEQLCSRERNPLLLARYYYIIGQLYESNHQQRRAYDAFAQVLRLSPPLGLLCAAEIKALENSPITSKERTSRVKALLASPKYNQKRSLVYLAQARMAQAADDKSGAIHAYEAAVKEMDYNDPNLKQTYRLLGDLFLASRDYTGAWDAYSNSNMGLTPEGADTIQALAEISENMRVIHRQDSLLLLASLSDTQIDSLRNKSANLENPSSADDTDMVVWDARGSGVTAMAVSNPSWAHGSVRKGRFYFDDPVLVERGKQEFKRKWGNRKLRDFWQQSRRTQKASERLAVNNDAPVSYNEISSAPTATNPESTMEVPHTPQAVKASEALIIRAYLDIITTLRDRLRLTDESIRYRQILERRFPDQIPPPTP